MAKKNILDTFRKITLFLLVLPILFSCNLPGRLTPGDQITPEEHINLGMTHERNGKLNEALREYRIAAQQNAHMAYLYMGNIYFQQDALDDAEKCYTKAINKTNDPRAYNNLAWLYYREDIKLDAAEKLAGKAVELSPDAQDFKDTLKMIIEKRLEIQQRGI